jgi:hypothetical protein
MPTARKTKKRVVLPKGPTSKDVRYPKYPTDPNDMTPRQRKEFYDSEKSRVELEEKQGKLCPIEEVESERRMVAEVLNNDLMSLGTRLAAVLSGRKYTPGHVRETIDAEVVLMMKRWKAGGLVDE